MAAAVLVTGVHEFDFVRLPNIFSKDLQIILCGMESKTVDVFANRYGMAFGSGFAIFIWSCISLRKTSHVLPRASRRFLVLPLFFD